jgi:hypothetical protein
MVSVLRHTYFDPAQSRFAFLQAKIGSHSKVYNYSMKMEIAIFNDLMRTIKFPEFAFSLY